MIEYVDKQAILNIIASFRTPYRKEVRVEDIYDAVNKVEPVEIIHCKDCGHYVNVRDSLTVNCSFGECDCEGFFGLHTYSEWYCGNAERRKDETN